MLGLNKKMLMNLALSLTAVSALSFTGFAHAEDNNGKAKNVIIFIGDGMGAATRQAIRLTTVGVAGDLEMNNMPYSGMVHTSSTSVVTDSAASATAFAAGVKTYNGAIGVDANK